MWMRTDRNAKFPAPKHKHLFLRKLDRVIEYATDVPFTKHEAELATIFLDGLLGVIDRAYERDRNRLERRRAAEK